MYSGSTDRGPSPSDGSGSKEAAMLDVSVIVATRGRPEQIAGCVESILANGGAFEVLFVDQSDDASTELALAGYLADPRLRYLRSATRGVSAARNAGIAATTGRLVAFTDDDCRVAPDWIERMLAVFRADPAVAVVCGRVRAPAGADLIGFTPVFEPRTRVYAGVLPRPEEWGISANMGVRREVFREVGPFDDLLGVGAPLGSAAEYELLFRVWQAGRTVVNAAEVEVTHFGTRAPGDETRALLLRYSYGTAAAFVKHVRLGELAAVTLYVRWLTRLLARNVRAVVTGTRPTGLSVTAAFVRGSVASFRYRLDRHTRMYAVRR